MVNDDSKTGKKPSDVIELVLKEAKAYTSMDLIESYIAEKKSLADLPVQPLYVTIRNLPIEVKSHALSLLSQEQRKVFYDLDLWKKDELDVKEFEGWVTGVAKSPDDKIRFEFASGSEFLTFLKGRFNIWTFDVEDPLYPDHDYYFLTEDNLLLVEYDDNCDIVDEVKNLIRDLYTELGVEKAYQTLFAYVSESYMQVTEDEYRFKKNRLIDYGFVDYFDSLELVNALPSLGHVDLFISKKNKINASIDDLGKVQTLHQNSIVAFENNHDAISVELAKVKDESRYHYLHFNFVRTINGNMEYAGVFKDGPVAMTRVGKKVRNIINLGLDYIKSKRTFTDDCLFDYFDFSDLFKVGNTLVSIVQKRVKRELAKNDMDEFDDKFMGQFFENYLDDLFNYEVLVRDIDGEPAPVCSVHLWNILNGRANLIISLLPFVKQMRDGFSALMSDGRISSHYYLNYETADIDFEAIIISNLVNYSLDKFSSADGPKMGVTIDEYKEFSRKFIENEEALKETIDGFLSQFGLSEVNGAEVYLFDITMDQMSGYVLADLTEDEFKHLGGPIIFNTLS